MRFLFRRNDHNVAIFHGKGALWKFGQNHVVHQVDNHSTAGTNIRLDDLWNHATVIVSRTLLVFDCPLVLAFGPNRFPVEGL